MDKRRFMAIVFALGSASASRADWPANWHEPHAPFHIVGNIYYVGSAGIAAYLFVSPDGNILLDGTLEENVPAIERNIAALGFRLSDVKILLNSHAHFDHAAGLAALKRDTGAVMMASAADKPILESGHILVDTHDDLPDFPPVKVDHVLKDGETVQLGVIKLKATLTPGHTPGCTSWSTHIVDHGRALDVVIPCSITSAGNKLVANAGYPNIVADYRQTFVTLGAMKADVVLTAHPELADVLGRQARRSGDGADAFVDRELLPRIVANARDQFEKDLKRDQNMPHSAAEPH